MEGFSFNATTFLAYLEVFVEGFTVEILKKIYFAAASLNSSL